MTSTGLKTGNTPCSICSKIIRFSHCLGCDEIISDGAEQKNRLSVTVDAACFVLCANFHYAEVAAQPMSHADYSKFDTEAECDASDAHRETANQAVAQVRVTIKATWLKEEKMFTIGKECQFQVQLDRNGPTCTIYWAYCKVPFSATVASSCSTRLPVTGQTVGKNMWPCLSIWAEVFSVWTGAGSQTLPTESQLCVSDITKWVFCSC